MGVSKNRGTPKWMVDNGHPYQNGGFGGKTHYFRKHPYMYKCVNVYQVLFGDIDEWTSCLAKLETPLAEDCWLWPMLHWDLTGSPDDKKDIFFGGTKNSSRSCMVRPL